jgi:hypothetical protein
MSRESEEFCGEPVSGNPFYQGLPGLEGKKTEPLDGHDELSQVKCSLI